MRFVNSEECAKSELDIFSVPPTQTSIEEGVWDTISPHPNFESNSVIRFDVTGTNSSYVNLAETELHLDVQIRNKKSHHEGYKLNTDRIAPVNNFLHSLFEQVQVNLGDAAIENTNKTYAYRAYFENLLCYGKESKQTLLHGDCWFKDEVDFNSTALEARAANETTGVTQETVNPGFLKRHQLFANNNIVPLAGKIHCDIVNCPRYLISNLSFRLELVRAKKSFYLKGEKADDFEVIIKQARLKVRRMTISPQVMIAHAMALEKTTAKYPIKRVICKPFILPYRSSKFTLSEVHRGIMPTN